jgi:hypothetical protein
MLFSLTAHIAIAVHDAFPYNKGAEGNLRKAALLYLNIHISRQHPVSP